MRILGIAVQVVARKQIIITSVDVALLLIATLIALALRENFVVSATRLQELSTYFVTTAVFGLLIYAASPSSLTIWRFSTLPDYRNVAIATGIVVALTTGMMFAWDRLASVARSLPFLQLIVAVVLQIG
ncbi:MAG: hypothetical protein AAFR27_12745, partial [Pseudomonadota bacterium]